MGIRVDGLSWWMMNGIHGSRRVEVIDIRYTLSVRVCKKKLEEDFM